ncbi:MAG: type II secretion system protein [Candidatus Omnitrophota bacterium]
MKSKKGFTLVEIMIVVAIISLLAAIAIPNLLRARHNANESAAIGALRTISTACESYRAAQTPPAYPAGFAQLLNPPLGGPAYIDTQLAGGAKNGYTFTLVPNALTGGFLATATPTNPGTSGTRIFTVTETGVIWDESAVGGRAPIGG